MRHYLNAALFYCGTIALAIALNACSISTSSTSISDSSGSFSKSSESLSDSVRSFSRSSASLAPDGGTSYEEDVQDYTYAYVKSAPSAAADYNAFQKGLSGIAADNGIADWEADPHTYRGIGKGLKKAKIRGVSYETYKQNLTGSNPSKMNALQKGYESLD